jgi:hypothetical protein
MKALDKRDTVVTALLTVLLYGTLYVVHVLAGFEYPNPLSTLVIMPISSPGTELLWVLNPYGLTVTVAAVLAYSVAVVAWLRGSRGFGFGSSVILLFVVTGSIILLLLWEDVSMALRPVGPAVPLEHRIATVLSVVPMGVRVVVGALIQCLLTLATVRHIDAQFSRATRAPS